MTLPLTKPGRENLEAILAEFERAGRHYPPLYHQQLIAWSEKGEVILSDAQWLAFIDAESNDLDDGEWSEWDGPHSASPGFSGTYLGRWYGDPDGMPEFFNLVESLTDVLKREDFSRFDSVNLSFAFGSWIEWISTIHYWAFQFQMPLLRSDMSLWGTEEANLDDFYDFYELSEQLSQTGDVSWPLHPVSWSLTYNVFTSSAAAIRAILRPETVIGVNEPWPFSELSSLPLPPEGDVIHPKSYHLIVHDEVGWSVHFADDPHPVRCTNPSGIHVIAVLITFSGQEQEASQLAQYGTRKCKMDSSRTSGKKPFPKQSKDNAESRQRTEKRLKELSQERAEALRDNDVAAIADLDEENRKIKEQYNVIDDDGEFKVKPQRAFRTADEKQAYDLVAKNIRNAIEGLKKSAPQHRKAIEELEDQIRLPTLIFEQKEQFTPWEVETRMGQRNR